MATWLVGTPWLFPARTRLRLDARSWLQARNHLNKALQTPSPASVEIASMPYPTERPDTSIFEPASEEYVSACTRGIQFTPLNSSETLVALVAKGEFSTATSLRKEMLSHEIPIPRDDVYLRAALHAITDRREKARTESFAAWLSLAPDRHEAWQSFHDIRQRLFKSMDHLNLDLVYHFGVVLASKGYCSGDAAMQVVSTLARYAQPSVVGKYLREVEEASRNYHLKIRAVLPPDVLAGAYNLAVRRVALGGNDEAAHGLISMARSRGIHISDFTLNIIAKHAPDRQVAIQRIRTQYPSWSLLLTGASSTTVDIPTEPTVDIAELATRLRSLRTALRSPFPPSPHALHSFVISYHALGRTRALSLLRSLAFHRSPKSASTWVFTEMLHRRTRREHMHVLFLFSQHFDLVGIPRKTLLSLIRGARGRQARKEPIMRWVTGPCPLKAKLWPSAYHTALVWDAVVALSSKTEHERLYTLLCALVRASRSRSRSSPMPGTAGDPAPRLQLPFDAFDAAHFSPFVAVWARRSLTRATGVLQDMVQLGIEPSVVQWSMIARGHAQHGDAGVALRILDRLTDLVRGTNGDGDKNVEKKLDVLLGVHTNVQKGFVVAGDLEHAREVERRLVNQLEYREGDRPATDACMDLLRTLEQRMDAS